MAATCAAWRSLVDVTCLTSGLSSRETRRTAERPLRHVCLPRPVVASGVADLVFVRLIIINSLTLRVPAAPCCSGIADLVFVRLIFIQYTYCTAWVRFSIEILPRIKLL